MVGETRTKMNNKEKKNIRDMIGGWMSLYDIRDGQSHQAEYPVDLISNYNCIGIGNLNRLKIHGFELLGAGITEDDHFYISVDIHKPKSLVTIER